MPSSRIEISIPPKTPFKDWYATATKRAKKEASKKGVAWIDADVVVRIPVDDAVFWKKAEEVALHRDRMRS